MKKTLITRRLACASAIAASNALLSSATAQQAAPANQPRAGGAGPSRLVSPETATDGKITFRISAPRANQVVVLGDWPGGARVPMA